MAYGMLSRAPPLTGGVWAEYAGYRTERHFRMDGRMVVHAPQLKQGGLSMHVARDGGPYAGPRACHGRDSERVQTQTPRSTPAGVAIAPLHVLNRGGQGVRSPADALLE